MRSLRPETIFWKMLLWEFLLVVAVYACVQLYAGMMGSLEPLMQQIAQPSSDFTFPGSMMLQNSGELVKQFQFRIMAYTAGALVFLALAWSFFKSLVYTTLLGKRLTARFYGRFIIAELVWSFLLAVVFFLIQFVLYKTLFFRLADSVAAQLGLIVVSLLMLGILSYFTVVFFIIFTRSDSFRQCLGDYFDVCIKRVRLFIMPIIFAILVFVVLNLIMRLLVFMPRMLSFIVTTLLLLLYIVWLKVYYLGCIREREGHPSPAVHHMHREVPAAPHRHAAVHRKRQSAGKR
jgi:hypothetical protein